MSAAQDAYLKPIRFSPADVRKYYSARLPDLRQSSASEWRCPCPIHNGKRESFAINAETGLWTCHSDCNRGGDILELEQSLCGGDFKTAKSSVFALIGRVSDLLKPATRRRGEIACTYDYVDEAGELLFQAVRFDPKDFSQRRPDGAGGWIYKLDGVKLVPYRLPAILATSEDKPIFICEGEKDVHAFEDLKIVATCNPMGAGKWRPDYNQYFAGKAVIICPDNDEVGLKHARQVYENLRSVAAEVRFLIIPAPHKDVSDWLNAGGSADDLRDYMVKELPVPVVIAASRPDPAAADPGADWREELDRKKNRDPKANELNVLQALMKAPALKDMLAWDEFHLRIIIVRETPWGSKPGLWTDRDYVSLAIWCQGEGIEVRPDTVGPVVLLVAHKRPQHVVKNYFDGLKWDGVPRLDRWLTRYLGVEETPYSRAVGAKWLISGVARIRKPGEKVDTILVLEGKQGIGKSRALKILAGEWFADSMPDLHTKDAALQLGGALIIEFAELDSLYRSEAGTIKAFLSRSTDRYRPPYGKNTIDAPRQCVFAGTVNDSEYLKDATGGRRFWPIKCGEVFDLEGLERDRDQLWAEAVARCKAGEKHWLDEPELVQAAADQQAERFDGDAWQGRIEHWLIGKPSATTEQILEHCLEMKVKDWNHSAKIRIARCMAALGWEKKQVRDGADRGRAFVRPDPS